jgi:UDP-N-acetylmuramate dehydrogenase
VLFKPADQDDLQYFLKNCSDDIPVHIFGVLSNCIIRDGGLRGVTIRLGREFADINVEGNLITAGTLALDASVAKKAAESGLGGLEFFSGIPGSIGGALRMNAGCYGVETKDVLVECQALDRQGNIHTLIPDQMGMTYRHVEVPEDYIFLSAMFEGKQEDPETVQGRMEDIKEKREQSQPIREKTGGSTFANPSAAQLSQAGLSEDTKVWQLIDEVGGRGLKIGGAMMSEKHCNFMINTGEATAADLESLGEEIRTRVADKYGITLRWEIRRIGESV